METTKSLPRQRIAKVALPPPIGWEAPLYLSPRFPSGKYSTPPNTKGDLTLATISNMRSSTRYDPLEGDLYPTGT